MPIDSKHPLYVKWLPDWITCRDAYDGSRAIKSKGQRYLPKLKGQSNVDYNGYKERALYYSITSKTISALVGLALGKSPEKNVPDKIKQMLDDRSGTEFDEILMFCITQNLLQGRVGALVDRPINGGVPFVRLYNTESIINWDHDDDGRLRMVVLQEDYRVPSETDPYESEIKTRYRELRIGSDGFLEITLHTPSTGKSYVASQPMTITNTGVRMNEIPFFCANPFGLGFEPHKPPMLDIVEINLSHYRTSADLEHGRHFTGLPQPYITGAESQKEMSIGSSAAWVIPDPQARVGYLEFTGQGLKSLEKALSEKQSMLASMSARLIDNSMRGSEAAETVRLRYLSETASLRSIVKSVEALLNAVYSKMVEMEQISGEVMIKLNTDFLDQRMTPAAMKAWVDAFLSGAVSKEMFVYALRRGDSLPPPGEPIGTIPAKPEMTVNQPPKPPASTTQPKPSQGDGA